MNSNANKNNNTLNKNSNMSKSSKHGDPRKINTLKKQKPIEFKPGERLITPVDDFKASLENSEYTSQSEALYYMLRGDNVMLCGQAGTGKSWVINTFCDTIQKMNCALSRVGNPLNITITASTGAAAALIQGQTIHSWSGLGIEVDCPDENDKDENGFELLKSPRWKAALKRIRLTDILIIDEISMLPAYFITNLDKIMKIARHNNKPFGGVQIIMVGDFLQLPPVNTGELDKNGNKVDARMCFHSPAFGAAHPKYCYLDYVRRSNDDRLTHILNAMRANKPTNEDLKLLNSRYNAKPDASMQYTRLYTRNRNVDKYNASRLAELPEPSKEFRAILGGDKQEARKLKKNSGIPNMIQLRVGAVVMLTQNNGDKDNPNHVNGSIGVVTGFELTDDTSREEYGVIVKFNDHLISRIDPMLVTKTHKELVESYDKDGNYTGYKIKEVVDASVRFIPLKLAWAITVHKSQGQTLDGAMIDLHDSFQAGLGYVAISRVHSLDDIIFLNPVKMSELALDKDAFKADNVVRRKAKEARSELMSLINEYDEKERLLTLLAGSKRKQTQAWLDNNITPDMLFKDDASLYEWLLKRVNPKTWKQLTTNSSASSNNKNNTANDSDTNDAGSLFTEI